MTNYASTQGENMLKKLTVLSMFLFVFSIASSAQQNPFAGSWKLNLVKSKYDPGPPDKSITSNFEPSGANGVKSTTDQVNAEGTPIHYAYTANYDGKDYPVTGYAAFDMVSIRRTDPNTTLSVWKKGGTVVRIIRSVVAADGRTRTNSSVGINAQGKAYLNITFFDKQ
jgi:hypothetical protein